MLSRKGVLQLPLQLHGLPQSSWQARCYRSRRKLCSRHGQRQTLAVLTASALFCPLAARALVLTAHYVKFCLALSNLHNMSALENPCDLYAHILGGVCVGGALKYSSKLGTKLVTFSIFLPNASLHNLLQHMNVFWRDGWGHRAHVRAPMAAPRVKLLDPGTQALDQS